MYRCTHWLRPSNSIPPPTRIYMQHNITIYHRLRLKASAVGKDFNLRLAKNKVNIYQVNAKIMQCHVLLCKKVSFTFHVKHKQWLRLHMSPLHTVYNILKSRWYKLYCSVKVQEISQYKTKTSEGSEPEKAFGRKTCVKWRSKYTIINWNWPCFAIDRNWQVGTYVTTQKGSYLRN